MSISRSLSFAAAVMVLACEPPASRSDVPALPPKTGAERAALAGKVLDANGLPVSGATVVVAESDDQSVTDAAGRWAMQVPANATVTLRALKVAYANTSLTSVVLSPNQVVEGFNILMVPGPTIGSFNALAGPAEDRGVLAVSVNSLSGRCSLMGATISIDGIPTAKSVYVESGNSQPDRNVPAMRPDSKPNAWVVGVPEGTGEQYAITFTKAGCAQLSYPVDYLEMSWLGGYRVQAKGLTQIALFTE